MTQFKNYQGVRYTKGLFFETTLADKTSVVYTLKDEDHEGFPSLYRLYMQEADPYEHNFALKHLDGWDHWEMLTECSWFKPYLERWRRELAIKIKATAYRNIVQSASGNGRDKFAANRYLLEWSREPAGASKAGRPTKEAVRREAHRQASEASTVASDFERLNLN